MFSRFLLAAFTVLLVFSCKEKEDPTPIQPAMYFPPLSGDVWETTDPQTLGWNTAKIPELNDLLESNGTRAFIILHNGRIVMEEYFGQRITGGMPFDQNSLWYWASAGKTLTATLVGLAQEEGKLDITKPSSTYLGAGWTSLNPAQESKITVWHQLTMTSGLDDGVADPFDTRPAALVFKADPGTRWAYHNAPYTLLDQVVEGATGQSFSNYFNTKLGSKIGMTGSWQKVDFNNIYFSNARSMARFGLMVSANGSWNREQIIEDKEFLQSMINTSQNLNDSYGYLWWLNGKSTFMVPGLQSRFPGSVIPNAPADMYCGLGKDGQYVCVIPSRNLVLVRMGSSPDQALVPFMFLNDIWGVLTNIIP